MSQRDQINHPSADDAIGVRYHPRTGEKLEPIGVFRGRVVWPQMGASDEGENGNAGADNNAGQNDDQGGDGGQQNNDGGSSGSNDGSNQGQSGTETVSKADFDALFARMQAADRRASKAEQDLRAAQDAGKTEQQRKDDEREAAIKERDALRAEVRNARIANAFLTVTGFNWHDPSDALDMLMARYLDGVDIDDNGKVNGIDAAVKKMAKDKPYLIKAESSSTAADQMNGTRKGEGNRGDQKARDESLIKRFPAMQRGARS